MNKIRIAFLIDTIETNTAGTQKQLIETISRLDRTHFQPELICLWQSKWMQSNSLPCDVTVLNFRGFLKRDCLSTFCKFGRLLDEKQFDIVQTFFEDSIFFTYFSSFLAKNRPVLISSRRDIGLGAGNQPWYHGIYKRLLPFVNRRYDYVIANSQSVKDYVCKRERLDSEKVRVYYNGVNMVSENSPQKPLVFEDSQDSTIWICIVASLTPVKRHDLFVRALRKVLDHDSALPPVKAIFLGEGPLEQEIRNLAHELDVQNCIEFAGAVDNVGSYLKHCHIGVLCSDREGLPNAILEYMSHRLPVVATQAGGNSELVTHDTGKCVPIGNAQAISDALVALIKDPVKRSALGRAGYRRIESDFSWTNAMGRIQEFYSQVLHRDRSTE